MTRLERMVQFYNSLGVEGLDIAYFADEQHESFDDLEGAISDGNGFDVEIIYYGSAMQFLKDNDISLKESLTLAYEYGFRLDTLNSETLASLLASQICREEFYELREEINDFFESLNNKDEEE